MQSDNETLEVAIQARSRYRRRVLASRSRSDRLAEFQQLQQAAYRVLRSSAQGYSHFLRRNLSSRRVEVKDGVWRAVSPARRARQA